MNYSLPLSSLRIRVFLFRSEKIFSFFYKSILIVLLLACTLTSFGQTSIKDGIWNDVSNWSGGIPTTNVTGTGSTTAVVIDSKNITLSTGITVASGNNYSITLNNNGTLVITGDVVINGAGTLDLTGDVVINGNLTLGTGSSISVRNNHSLQVTGNVSVDGGISVNGILTVGGTLTKIGASSSITVSNTSVLQVGSDASIAGNLTATGGATLKFGGKLNLTNSDVTIDNSSTTLVVTGDVDMKASTLKGADSKWTFLSSFTANAASSIVLPTNSGAYMAVAGNFSGKISAYPSPYNLYVGGTNNVTSSDANFTKCNGVGISPHPSSGCNVGNWADFINQNSPFVNSSIPATPGAITGSTMVCPNKTGVVYSVASVLFATSYEWTLPTGATINGSATGNIIAVDFASFAGGSISVKAKNAFGVSVSSSNLNIAVFTVSAPIISGPASACEASTGNIYTTATGCSNYSWSVSAGGTITSGGATGDNSVTIKWLNVGSQSVSVSYADANFCLTNVITWPVTVNTSYTPSVVITKTSADICQGSNVTFKATPTNGGITPLYQWFINNSSIETNSTGDFSHFVTANDGITCQMTSSLCTFPNTNPAKSNKLAGVVKYREVNLATVSPTAFCAGSIFTASISVPCAFPSDNVFTVQLSNATESFASPVNIGTITAYSAGTYSISCTIPTSTPTGTNYRIRVVSSYMNALEGISQPSTLLSISSTTGTTIDPATYGTAAWNVFCYSGSSYNYNMATYTYMGYYTENNLSFDSRTRWTSGASPATANSLTGLAYQGCSSMPASYIALSFKRTNIACGYYQINIPYHDDTYELYIDGVLKASHYGCCDTHTNVWTGWLSPSSKVEFRLFQGNGGSGLQVDLVNANSLVVSPNVTICNGSSTTLTASAGAGVTYSWSPATGLNTSSGPSVIASPITTILYTVTATEPTTLCATSKSIQVTVSPTFTLAASATPTTTVCGGVTSTTLTASGANTYVWSSVPSGTSSTSNSITVSPTSTVDYTVTGSIGSCAPTQQKTIKITGMNPGGASPIAENVYGDGTWNAFCYATTTYTNYYGYYTEDNLSFDTKLRGFYDSNTSLFPSSANSASGLAYSGCTVPATYSISFKRTNIPCGYYTLNIDLTDDSYSFWINGVQKASSGYSPVLQSNVWTGFVGPSSKLELRVANTGGPGQLKVTFVPVLPNTLIPSPTICATKTITLSTSTTAGVTYVWSAENSAYSGWLSNVTASTVAVTPPTGTAEGYYNFICRTTDTNGTGCFVDQTLPVEVHADAHTSVSPTSATAVCPTSNIKLTALGANSYTWTAVPAGSTAGLSATTGAVVTVNPTVTTTYYVSGSNSCNSSSASAVVTVNSFTDPSTYPTGKWNAYVYASTATASPINYVGFYSFGNTTAYNFGTSTQWNTTAGPSAANLTTSGYSGCAIGATGYTISFKRTGFDCGYYQIAITTADDVSQLYIDGTLQTTLPWKGYLTSTTKVEFRFTNSAGAGSFTNIFTKISPIESLMPLAPAVCSGGAVGVNLTVTASGTGNSYLWSPTNNLSDPSNATTNANPTVATTYTVSVLNCGGTVIDSKSVTVDVLSPSVISVQPVDKTICENSNTAFSITSSNPMGFEWLVSADNGLNWSTLTSSSIYSGVSTKDLALTSVPYSLNGMKYKCMTTVCVNNYSDPALLTVKQAPTLTLGSYKIAGLCAANFSIPFTTTGSPTVYSLGSFGTSAAITDATLSSSPLLIPIPTSLTEGTYTPSLKVKDVASGCESLPVTLSLILKKVTPFSVYCKKNK